MSFEKNKNEYLQYQEHMQNRMSDQVAKLELDEYSRIKNQKKFNLGEWSKEKVVRAKM